MAPQRSHLHCSRHCSLFIMKGEEQPYFNTLCLVATCLPELMALFFAAMHKERKTALVESVQINAT